jgi:predicted RNase H-like nuclease (RuvC/YqgF family)
MSEITKQKLQNTIAAQKKEIAELRVENARSQLTLKVVRLQVFNLENELFRRGGKGQGKKMVENEWTEKLTNLRITISAQRAEIEELKREVSGLTEALWAERAGTVSSVGDGIAS